MIVPSLLGFSAKKLEFRAISIFSCALAHAFQGVPENPNLDRQKIFRAIKYDLRNHSNHPAMIVPHFLHFSAKQLEFRAIPIFLCVIAHAFRVVPGPPDPYRLKFFRTIKYDLRNHSIRPAMIVPHFLRFSAKQLEFRAIPIFLCVIAHAFRVVPGPPDPYRLIFFRTIK